MRDVALSHKHCIGSSYNATHMNRRITQLAVADIITLPQVRTQFDAKAISDLADTMRLVGLQQPVLVRQEGEKFLLIDGERRLRAVKELGWTALDAIVVSEPLSKPEAVQLQLITNCQRQDLEPMEKARGLASLMAETGWSASDVAQKVGLSNSTVSRLLALLALPGAIQAEVAAGSISASTAYALARIDDPEKQLEISKRAASGEVTRDEVVRALRIEGAAPASPSKGRAAAKLKEGRVVTVTAADLTLESFITALEDVLALARAARPKGIALKTFLRVLADQAKP